MAGLRASCVVVVTTGGAAGGATAGARPEAPDWAVRWSGRAGWDLWWHPESGPGTAAAAARLDTRVLVLRPWTDQAGRAGRRARVVAALQDLPDDAPVVADAAACAAAAGAALTLVHAVPRSFAERSVGLDGAVAHGRRLLDAAATRAARHEPGLPVDCELLRVRPHELVGEALDADLLVVGGPRRDRLAPTPPGLVAHSALHHAPCPVLLVPR
jgi:nucleotide-binding universal stress UspA family protein